jgi:hypothetical protein
MNFLQSLKTAAFCSLVQVPTTSLEGIAIAHSINRRTTRPSGSIVFNTVANLISGVVMSAS